MLSFRYGVSEPVQSGYASRLTGDAVIVLLAHFTGQSSTFRADETSAVMIKCRHQLYRAGLLKTDSWGHREVTEKGKVFAKMILNTPQPMQVSTPQWTDPRVEGGK